MTTPKDLLDEATRALITFQMIEEGLKCFMSATHQVLAKVCPPELTYRWNTKELDSSSLERLVSQVGKHCINEQLLKALNKTAEQRNYVAHRVFAKTVLAKSHGDSDLEAEYTRLQEVTKFAGQVLIELCKELKKLPISNLTPN